MAYVVPVGDYERMRYAMDELRLSQIVLDNRLTGKLRPGKAEQEAERLDGWKARGRSVWTD